MAVFAGCALSAGQFGQGCAIARLDRNHVSYVSYFNGNRDRCSMYSINSYSIGMAFKKKILVAVKFFSLVFLIFIIGRAVCHWLFKVTDTNPKMLGEFARSILNIDISAIMILRSFYPFGDFIDSLKKWPFGKYTIDCIVRSWRII